MTRENARSKEALEDPSLFDKDYLLHKGLIDDLRRAVSGLPDRDLLVLDIGSRRSPYRPLFTGRSRRYIALDIQPSRSVDVVGTAAALPIRSCSIDVCLCTQVLEHVESPLGVIAESARILRPGGTLLLSTHGVFHHHPHPHDYWRWTHEGLQRIVSASFDEVEVHPTGGGMMVLFHILGRGVFFLAEHRRYLRLLRWTIYPLLNLCGLFADRVVRYPGLSINYLAVARKK